MVEIDLLRTGSRSHGLTDAQLGALTAFNCLIAVNRSQGLRHEMSRTGVELFPCHLRKRLPAFGLPLVAPDPDVSLNLQAALDRDYEEGSYMLRINYTQPCLQACRTKIKDGCMNVGPPTNPNTPNCSASKTQE